MDKYWAGEGFTGIFILAGGDIDVESGLMYSLWFFSDGIFAIESSGDGIAMFNGLYVDLFIIGIFRLAAEKHSLFLLFIVKCNKYYLNTLN